MDARSCVITGSKASCRAAFFADSRAFVCVSARVCVKTIVDCGASGFARVCVLCVMSRVRASRFDWSRKRRTLHAFTCVVRSWASRAFVNCECRLIQYLARLIVVSFRVVGACG